MSLRLSNCIRHNFNSVRHLSFSSQLGLNKLKFDRLYLKHRLLYRRNPEVNFKLLHNNKPKNDRTDHRTTLNYACATLMVTLGCTYAAVPLYRIFCQAFSYGGTIGHSDEDVDISQLDKIKHREVWVKFNADVHASLSWNFQPQQTEIKVIPGETALAFYTAKNPLDRPVVGISTYNVVPFEVGQYFNKIQCFCFEEQLLNPHEQVDMPVFFYIDPSFSEDPQMENINDIVLSYTFFEVKDGMNLPIPSYYKPHNQ